MSFLFLVRLTDSEEMIREHLRSLRQSEARLLSVEKENLELHTKVNFLTKEKNSISRELERSKVCGTISGVATDKIKGLQGWLHLMAWLLFKFYRVTIIIIVITVMLVTVVGESHVTSAIVKRIFSLVQVFIVVFSFSFFLVPGV